MPALTTNLGGVLPGRPKQVWCHRPACAGVPPDSRKTVVTNPNYCDVFYKFTR